MKVTIEIDDSELSKLTNYKLVCTLPDYTELENNIGNFNELSRYEQEQIYTKLQLAVAEQSRTPEDYEEYTLDYAPGTPLGIAVSIYLGRSPNTDMRTYELDSVEIVAAEDADLTVSDYLK